MGYVVTQSGVRRDIARPMQHQVETWDGYDSAGLQTVTTTAITTNLDTERTNSNSDVFSLASDILTVSRKGVLEIVDRTTVGSVGDRAWEARTIIEVNTQPSELTEMMDIFIEGAAGEVLPRLVSRSKVIREMLNEA